MRCLIETEKLGSVEMDSTEGKVGEEWSFSLVNMAFQESKFNCHKSGTRPVSVEMAIGRREIRGD